jgi:hypothetical protein
LSTARRVVPPSSLISKGAEALPPKLTGLAEKFSCKSATGSLILRTEFSLGAEDGAGLLQAVADGCLEQPGGGCT